MANKDEAKTANFLLSVARLYHAQSPGLSRYCAMKGKELVKNQPDEAFSGLICQFCGNFLLADASSVRVKSKPNLRRRKQKDRQPKEQDGSTVKSCASVAKKHSRDFMGKCIHKGRNRVKVLCKVCRNCTIFQGSKRQRNTEMKDIRPESRNSTPRMAKDAQGRDTPLSKSAKKKKRLSHAMNFKAMFEMEERKKDEEKRLSGGLQAFLSTL